MIKINEPGDALKKEYGDKIIPKISREIEKIEITNKYYKLLQKVNENLEKLILSNIDTVVNTYNDIQSSYPDWIKALNDEEKLKEEQKNCNEFISKNIFKYEYWITRDTEFSYKVANVLNVPVCPYCNRMYTTTVKTKKGKTRPQFDHFYAKSKYPLLSLSLFNLVPACAVCNELKRDKIFSIEKNLYPYKEGMNNEKYFSYKLNKKSLPEIVTMKTNKKMNNNNQALILDEIYRKAHSNEVKELIDKSYEYHKIYIDGTLSRLLEKKISEEELKYFFGYTNPKDLSNVSLGKLKNDIIDETFEKRDKL